MFRLTNKKINLIFSLILPFLGGLFLGDLTLKSLYNTSFLSDFSVYYYISKSVFHLSRPDHPYTNFFPIAPYFYPPASLPIFYFVSILPFWISKAIWAFINLFLLIFSFRLLHNLFFEKINNYFWLMLLLPVFFNPFIFTYIDGQFNVVQLFIYTLGLFALVKNKNVVGGVITSIGAMVKVSPAILAVYALYKKKYKFIFIVVITSVLLVFLSELLVSKGINFYYARHVIDDVSTQSSGIGYRDQSVLAIVKFFDVVPKNFKHSIGLIQIDSSAVESLISYGIVAFILLILFVLELIHRHKFKDTKDYEEYLTISSLIIIATIGTGLTWYHQFVILFIPLFILLFLTLRIKILWQRVLIIIILALSYVYAAPSMEHLSNFYLVKNLFFSSMILLILTQIYKFRLIEFGEFSNSLTSNNYHKIYLSIFMFVTAFVIGMQITNINEILRDGRDRTRVSAINHLGKVLYKYDSELKVGKNNSNTGSIKIDEGYVRLANHLGDQQKELRILFVDPINNEEFNIEFSALNQSDFIINAKLESDRYKDNFGEFYTFECINKKCSSISVLDKIF